MTRYLLEMFRTGYSRSYIYELLDIDQPQWGMFTKRGSPKQAAKGIQALLRLLNDGRWNPKTRRWETPSFTPGSLPFELSKTPKHVRAMLLQKSNGRFLLVVWNEVKNWDSKTGTPVNTDPVNACLRIDAAVKQIRTFVPNDSGTKPISTLKETNAIPLDILDRPTVIEVQLA
jgi:hypothetical protein